MPLLLEPFRAEHRRLSVVYLAPDVVLLRPHVGPHAGSLYLFRPPIITANESHCVWTLRYDDLWHVLVVQRYGVWHGGTDWGSLGACLA